MASVDFQKERTFEIAAEERDLTVSVCLDYTREGGRAHFDGADLNYLYVGDGPRADRAPTAEERAAIEAWIATEKFAEAAQEYLDYEAGV